MTAVPSRHLNLLWLSLGSGRQQVLTPWEPETRELFAAVGLFSRFPLPVAL